MNVYPSESDSHGQHEGLASAYSNLARGFRYPDGDFREVLARDAYLPALARAVDMAGRRAALADPLAALKNGAAAIRNRSEGIDGLESDYIGLFEMHPDRPALHPYAHLYGTEGLDRIGLLQSLQRLYRSFGLNLKDGGDADQPDHITVQLEFLAYLHYRLAGIPAGPGEERARTLEAMETFYSHLSWIMHFAESLRREAAHPFYTPLADTAAALVADGAPVSPHP